MNHFISERLATRGLFSILSIVVVFHVLIILGIIPFQIVWGGRLNNRAEMIRFEIISIAINLIMLAVVGIKAQVLRVSINDRIIKIVFWIMFSLFVLNTIGNIFSNNRLETIIFTPLTLILAIFCFRLATSKR